ncbi:MAG: RluA family pseudouridine synthase [Candidatus Omnitrophica bacterium]|nr:RluA family pseudouridine synthase [Candidatus Omnitrophota bacterium]
MEKRFTISKDWSGKRLDIFLQKNLDSFSRTKLNALIKNKKVTVKGVFKKPSYALKENDEIAVTFDEEKKDLLKPFAFTVKIIYEDPDIIVVDKPTGLTVHPPHVNSQDTLINALLFMGKELSTVSQTRPGVVHRLDKETSGVMVLAKNNFAHLHLIEQFRKRQIKKEYLAICWGKVNKENLTVNLPLARDPKNRLKMKISFTNAKTALTDFSVLKHLRESTLFSIKPFTGRMHQIRVHLKFLEHPIVGDSKYGTNDGYSELLLHAHKLGLYHPREASFMEFTSAMPQRFEKFIEEHR